MNALLTLLGQGKARDAGEDVKLRELWLKLKEQEALGGSQSVPDYNTWKVQYLRTNGG